MRTGAVTGRAAVKPALAALVGLVYLIVFPLAFRDARYVLGVVATASVLSVISLGVWLTFMIGRINISQGAFALIGGYTTAILSTKYGVSFWLCLPLSAVAAGLAGTIVGWPILRLRGVYFAMITLSLTEATRLAFLNGGELTNGATGIVGIPRPGALSIAGMTLVPEFTGTSLLAFYYLAAGLLLLGLAAVWRISTSRLGWIFRSLRQNEELSASVGINVARYRVMAYAICCAIGGAGGSFFAAFHQNIYPATYSVSDSIYFMLYCFLGGLDYLLGPVAGAFLLVTSFELLQPLQQYQPLIYASLMIVCMLWLPNGILSLGAAVRRGERAPERAAPTLPAGAPAAATKLGKSD